MEMFLNRKRKPKFPCPGCFLHESLCICDAMPTLNLKTKVSLIIHKRELKRTTNTGRLALKALVNSEMRIRGEDYDRLDLSDILTNEYHTVLLYPSDDAINLDQKFVEKIDRPIQLIVPDGNWRQASKVHFRHSELKDIERVSICAPNLPKVVMRAENKPNGMTTIQAIAYALGVIEGNEVKRKLLDIYKLKLERTLASRGVTINAEEL